MSTSSNTTSTAAGNRPAATPLWIKVCGLRTVEAVRAAATAGADAVGFVFHADSPRNLELAAARELAAAVPAGVETVAVFLHPEQALVDAAIDAVRPDWIQTDASDFATLELLPSGGPRTLPVFRIDALAAPGMTGITALSHPRFLLEGARSGAAERIDWSMAAGLARQGDLVLAGGLDASSVAEAIATVRPFGVDVSSGVESTRGVKDVQKIAEFIRTARAAHRRLLASGAGDPAE